MEGLMEIFDFDPVEPCDSAFYNKLAENIESCICIPSRHPSRDDVIVHAEGCNLPHYQRVDAK